MTYLPGETISVTVVGTVAQVWDTEATGDWPELHLDVESAEGGLTLRIPLSWPNVDIRRITPAAGAPKPGELWTNRHGEHLFVAKDRHGNPQFVTVVGGPYSVESMNNSGGPLTPIYPQPERELKPEDEEPSFVADKPEGGV